MVRSRLFAAASLATLAAFAVGTAGSSASSTSGVSFTSQATSANIVAHYVVSPTGAARGNSSASTDEGFAPKWPKGDGPASMVGSTGGVAGTSGAAVATATTPPASASFIGMQSSSTICN